MAVSRFISSLVARVIAGCLVVTLFAASVLVAKRHKGQHEINLADALGKEQLIDMAIIGSGPAGLGAAVYGLRGNCRTVIIQGGMPGGLLTQTTYVENWPGEDSILGPDIIQKMNNQVKKFGAEFIADTVASIDASSWPYKITLDDGAVLHAMTIIMATGSKPKKLGIPGEDEYWGLGVTACATCDAPFFVDKDVCVIGGGDSAAEEAMQLVSHVRSVTVLVRKDRMRAAARMQERLKANPKIKIQYNVEVHEVLGDGSKVTGVRLYDNQRDVAHTMPIDGVFLAIGHDPNSALLNGIADIDDAGYIVMQGRTQRTSCPGIFAAGDVEDDRYKQATKAAGNGAAAAIDAIRFLNELGYTPGSSSVSVAKPSLDDSNDGDESLLSEITSQKDLNLELKRSKTPILIDFYTEECASCKHMMPAVASLMQRFSEKVRIFKVNAAEAQDLVKAYDIRRVPTFMLIAANQRPVTSDKITSKKELVAFIEDYLAH